MQTFQTLTLDEAELVLDAAQAKCREIGVLQVLCVADNAGYPIALRRLDGGKVTSVQIAMNKAFTAACHRRPTDQYKNAQPSGDAFGIFTQHDGRFTTLAGWPVLALVNGQNEAAAFRNVCRHQGMGVLEIGAGNCAELRCKYHGWSYGLDGRFVAAPSFVAPAEPASAENNLERISLAC